MEAVGYACQNCGTPLDAPGGAGSVVCPSCNGLVVLREDGGEAAATALSSIDTKMDSVLTDYANISKSLERANRVKLDLYELQTVRDEYRQEFLPSKETAGKRLNEELSNFDRAHPTGAGGVGGLAVVFIGLLAAVGMTGGRGEPASGLLLLAVLATFAALIVRLGVYVFRRRRRGRMKSELAAKWKQWREREQEYKDRIAMLEKKLNENGSL